VCSDRDEWIDASAGSRRRSRRISGDDVPLTTTLAVAGSDERANTLITWSFEDDLIGEFARIGISRVFGFAALAKARTFF
jgi:hypothetical protein